MARDPLPDLSIVLGFLRSGQGWSQAKLGQTAGISPNLINDYEQGRKRLTRQRLEHLVSFLGVPPERIDATLVCLEGNRAASRSPGGPGRRIESVAGRAGKMATGFVRSLLSMLTVEGEAIEARQTAERLWQVLKPRTHAQRLAQVEESAAFRTWALCERVAAESIERAANHPKQALELAELALRIAELVPGEEVWSWRLQGYAGVHVSNARRVCNDLPGAREAMTRALKLWEDGAPGDPGLLHEAWVPWIEAALYKDERKFSKALKRIDEALDLDNGELRGKILITKSGIFDALGDPQGSTDALREAVPMIDEDQEPRLAFGLRFNLLVDLCHLGHASEVALNLPGVRELAERLGEELDLARMVWLEGKVSAGLGRNAEAEAAFEQVRRTFISHELAYDYALTSLDLALVFLEQGRTAEVHKLAEEMLGIFRSQKVPREALAALRIFCDAAKQESATVELTRRVIRFLHRSQHDPELRFEVGEGAGAP
ncbi:MAG TPA: helix-turn-helix transcriptional regulator [Thermoanaerobaculia bacterium]